MEHLLYSFIFISLLTAVCAAVHFWRGGSWGWGQGEVQGDKLGVRDDQVKPQGFGSIWNNNSWFYEEKNFTKFAKEWLKDNMSKI